MFNEFVNLAFELTLHRCRLMLSLWPRSKVMIYINRMITLTGDFYLLMGPLKCYYNKRLITLNVITLNGFHGTTALKLRFR